MFAKKIGEAKMKSWNEKRPQNFFDFSFLFDSFFRKLLIFFCIQVCFSSQSLKLPLKHFVWHVFPEHSNWGLQKMCS